MMRRLTLAAAFALLSAPAFSQDTTTLAQEYVNMPEVQEMITQMFSPASMGAQVIANLPSGMVVTDAQEQQIGQTLSQAMHEIRPRMEELMISTSAEIFTVPELEALIAFYRSEHGAAVMAKTQPMFTQIMATLGPEMQSLQARVAPEILKILQGE